MGDGRFQWSRIAILLLGVIVGTTVQAQEDGTEIPNVDPRPEIGRWQMFSPEGEGILSTIPFLYDTATGRVWRFFSECGDDPDDGNGCLVQLPAYPETDDTAALILEAMTRAMEEAMESTIDQNAHARFGLRTPSFMKNRGIFMANEAGANEAE